MKTKRFLFFIKKQAKVLTFLILLSFVGCGGDYQLGLPPQHGNPPPPPTVVSVENLNGAAIIHFQAPALYDILAITATYEINNVERIVRASIFNNSLRVEGFGRAGEHTVFLRTVDNSRNESVPVAVTINPLTPPVEIIFESLQAFPTFGGIWLSWENELQNNIVVSVSVEDEYGEWYPIEHFFSSELNGRGTVRGLPEEETEFRIQVRDRWDNFSEMLYVVATPWFEERIPPGRFHELSPTMPDDVAPWGPTMPVRNIWNGVIGLDGNLWHSIGTPPPGDLFLTFGLGQLAELSRFRIWQRRGTGDMWSFNHNNLRRYTVYGATIITPEMRAAGGREGWTRLIDVVSHRPSGPYTAVESPLTQEDRDFAAAGEEIEFPVGIPAVRYIRIFLNEPWNGGRIFQITEIQFWGSVLEY